MIKYHYHYQARIITGNTLLGTTDGILINPVPVKTFEDYLRVKHGICDEYKKLTGHTGNINIEITSFTLIWTGVNE